MTSHSQSLGSITAKSHNEIRSGLYLKNIRCITFAQLFLDFLCQIEKNPTGQPEALGGEFCGTAAPVDFLILVLNGEGGGWSVKKNTLYKLFIVDICAGVFQFTINCAISNLLAAVSRLINCCWRRTMYNMLL